MNLKLPELNDKYPLIASPCTFGLQGPIMYLVTPLGVQYSVTLTLQPLTQHAHPPIHAHNACH